MAEAQLKKINSAEWLSMAYTRLTELLNKLNSDEGVSFREVSKVKALFEKAYSPDVLDPKKVGTKDAYFNVRRVYLKLKYVCDTWSADEVNTIDKKLREAQTELTLHKNAHPDAFGRVDIDSYQGKQPYSEFLVSRGAKEVEKEGLVDFLASQMQYLEYDLGREKPDAKEIARKKNAIYNNIMALKQYAKGSEALTGLFEYDVLETLSKNISGKKYSGAQENLRDISDILSVYRDEQEALPNMSQPALVEKKKTEKPSQPTVAEPQKKAKVETAETEEPRGEQSKAAWKLYAATPRMKYNESDGYNKLEPLNAEQQTKRVENKLGFTEKMEKADPAEAQKLHNGIYIMVLGRGYDATLKTFSNMKDIATAKEMLLYMWDSEKGASKLADDMRKEKYGGKPVMQSGVAWWTGNFKVVVGEVEHAKKGEPKPPVTNQKVEEKQPVAKKEEKAEAKYYSSMAEIRKEFKKGFLAAEGGLKMRASPEKLSGAMLQLNSELNALLLQRKQEGKPGLTREEIKAALSERRENEPEPPPAVKKAAVNIQPKTEAPAQKEEKAITFDSKNGPLAEKTKETAEKKDKAEKSGGDAAKAEADKKAAEQKKKDDAAAKAEADKKAAEQKKAEQNADKKLQDQAAKERPPINLKDSTEISFSVAGKDSAAAKKGIVKPVDKKVETPAQAYAYKDELKGIAGLKWVHDSLSSEFKAILGTLQDPNGQYKLSEPEKAIEDFVKRAKKANDNDKNQPSGLIGADKADQTKEYLADIIFRIAQ